MKPDFQDVFWIVNQEMFKPKVAKDWLKNDMSGNLEYIRYQKVIPVYVKCVSDMYDGTTQFDITPVDVRDGKTKYWQWSRAVSDDEIGKTVFRTEEECTEYFKKNYTDKQRQEFSEKDQFRRLQQ